MTLDQPNIEPVLVRGEEGYRLEDPYFYQWQDDRGFWRRIAVPAGFLYDGASVPRLVWTMTGIVPDGLIRAAALLHDFLYEHRGAFPYGSLQFYHSGWCKDVSGVVWSRKQADELLYRVMIEAGCSPWKAKLSYTSVRLFGLYAWMT